ncbi:hypothetical protein CTAYLR_005917 [Chrysophaeum taylorii]|uniref:Ion transport domain-containing protein n=1 Tax=Chrysophaeum taylorii TaxID=2483200 RepID=A0AAD7UCJ3_9STRA|nr:hypothetical protein CTAYLR_005917 [Chrysophaeum taylorii]
MRAAARIGNGTGSVEVALDESSIVVALFPWPREVDFLTSTLKTRTLDAIDVTSEDHLGELLLVQGPKLLDELGFLADTQELPARRLLLDLALTFETLAPYVVAALAAVLLVQLEYKLHGSVHARGSRYSKPPRFRNIWGKYLAVGLNAALVALNFVLVAAAVVKHGALRMRARSRIEAKDQGSTTATAARMSVEEAKRISLAASVVGRDTTRRQTFWMRALCVAAFFMAFSVLLRFTFGDPSTRVGRPSTIIIVVATTSCALIFLKDVRTHTGAILGGSEGVSGSNLVFASYKFVFDVVTTVDVANRILWLVLSTLALFIGVRRAPALACAQLVDIARSSETLRDVIRAVVRPILSGSLAVTGVFTLLVLLLFSFVAFIHLAADYRELSDDDDDFSVIHHCDDLVNCFATVLHFGLLAGGGMGDYLSFEVGAVPGRDWSFRRRLARMLFDLSFFIIVVVLLLNLVFGIIIDTFSQLRDIANERKGVLQGRCFVCGVARTSFEDSRRCVHVGNAPWYIWSPAPGGFVRHVHYEHNMWAYLLFVEHLARKPPTEYNGVESSVARRLNAGDLSWIPSGDSLILQAWTNKRN